MLCEQNNVFENNFVLFFTNGTTFISELFLQELYIKREKMVYN